MKGKPIFSSARWCPLVWPALLIILVIPFLPGHAQSPAPAAAKAINDLAQGEIVSGLASISTTNYANPKLDYFFYFPARLLKRPLVPHPVLVLVPGLSGRITRVNPATWGKAARDNGWIILSPHFIFDERNWETAKSYQFPELWSGRALLDIMKDFSRRQHLTLGRSYLHGVSAGAQFVVRFALWRPDLCLAVSAHAGGGTITPKEFIPVRFFVSIGLLDSTRRRQFDWFRSKASELGISVRSMFYEGGHGSPAAQILDSIRFFQEN
jgi:hypothetical protein